jgi:YHS domain-containing protein
MLRQFALATVAMMAGVLVAANAADEKKVEVKCVVAGSPAAKADKTADYKGGKVQFCCDGCKGKFEADSAKFATAANFQLAQTKQFKQVKCPMSGAPCKADKTVEVDGVTVAFCCDGCKGKAAGEKDVAKQKEMLFKNEAFDKAFEIVKK